MKPAKAKNGNRPLRLLILEDNEADAELVIHKLTRAGFDLDWKRVETEEDFAHELSPSLDIILSDYQLPGFNALRALVLLRERGLDIPFIVVTGALGDEAAAECIRKGATDYLLKDRLSRLSQTITVALDQKRLRKAELGAQKDLRESEQRFRRLIETSLEGVWLTDVDSHTTYINQRMADLLGYPPEEILGRSMFDFMADEDRDQAMHNFEQRRSGTVEQYDFCFLRKDGSDLWTICASSPILEENGEFKGAFMMVTDITERMRLQRQLERTRQQQLELKDRFLSHVSHELRTPLGVIHQFVTILLDKIAGDLNPEQCEYLNICYRNALELRKLIDDLLDAIRVENGKLSIQPETMSLGDLVEDVVKSLRQNAEKKGLTLRADVAAGLPPASADPHRVRQVLGNLVDNAIKFTPAKGTIQIRASVSIRNPDFLCVAVSDNGQGIDETSKGKIFERLYQIPGATSTSRKGLGLGLHICKELVTLHGGQIWVDSQLGEGTTFYFTLPILGRRSAVARLPAIKLPAAAQSDSVTNESVNILESQKA